MEVNSRLDSESPNISTSFLKWAIIPQYRKLRDLCPQIYAQGDSLKSRHKNNRILICWVIKVVKYISCPCHVTTSFAQSVHAKDLQTLEQYLVWVAHLTSPQRVTPQDIVMGEHNKRYKSNQCYDD